MRIGVGGLAAALVLFFIPAAHADSVYQLNDHGGGALGPDYGIRLDNGPSSDAANRHTFSFAPGVFLSIDITANTAQMYGTVMHNQGASNQLWDIVADLDMHLYTQADGTDWRSDTSGDLYDYVFADLSNAENTKAAGLSGTQLKYSATDADRLGFMMLDLTLTLQGGQGAPEYGEAPGLIILNEFPHGSDYIPFMFVRGHRLTTTSKTIVGFGWLADGDSRPGTQDFLFVLGDKIPEPASIALLACGLIALRRRRRR